MRALLFVFLGILGVAGCKQPTFIQASDLAIKAISDTFGGTVTTADEAQKLLSTKFVGQTREAVQQFLASAPKQRGGFNFEVSKYLGFDILRLRRSVNEGEFAARVVFSYDTSGHVKKCSVSFEFM